MQNTFQQILDKRNIVIDYEIEKANTVLQLAEHKKRKFNELVSNINLCAISEICNKLKMRCEFSAISHAGETIKDLDQNGLTIKLVLYPLDKCLIKPFAFAGYTTSGESKNEKRCNEKARNLETIFTETTGYKCDVSRYSFEVKSSATYISFCISVTLYIK